jgi:hypothetical protein
MEQKTSKKFISNPKKRMGDIPSSSNPDIEKTPGELPRGEPEVTPDIPKTRHTHPKLDGCGDESAGRKPALLKSYR